MPRPPEVRLAQTVTILPGTPMTRCEDGTWVPSDGLSIPNGMIVTAHGAMAEYVTASQMEQRITARIMGVAASDSRPLTVDGTTGRIPYGPPPFEPVRPTVDLTADRTTQLVTLLSLSRKISDDILTLQSQQLEIMQALQVILRETAEAPQEATRELHL